MLAALVIIFFGLLLLGLPIFLSMIIPSLVAMQSYFPNMDIYLALDRMVGGVDTFALMAVPFFMYAADLMSNGNIGKKLINLCNSIVGHLPGGLGMATVIACTIFGAISGAGPAAIVAIGVIVFPAMIECGYPRAFSLGLICSSSTLAMLIPPSIAMIMYGVTASSSIESLFFAGMATGVVVAFFFCVYVFIYAIRHKIPRQKRCTIKEILKAAIDAIWALGFPIIILGGIYLGIATPTEAAAIAVGYVWIIEGLVYRSLKLKDIWRISYTSARTVAMTYILMACGSLMSWILAIMQVPQTVAASTAGLPYVAVLICINLLFFVGGMFMDPTSLTIILVPIIGPIAAKFGMDSTHLGVLVTINAAIGMLTPPFGLNIFVGVGTFKVPYQELVPTLIPYILMMIAVLVLVCFFPDLALWLPNLMATFR